MTTRGERFVQAIIPGGQISAPVEPNPLQKALDDYHLMENELGRERERARAAAAQSHALLAEVGMLREAYERADGDRVRLQAIASTLLGRLYAINDTIAGAVRASIKDGIKAAEPRETPTTVDEAIEQRMDEARRAPAEPVERPVVALVPDTRPHGLGSPALPGVDWSRLPQGKFD